jgi:hypothetical protein
MIAPRDDLEPRSERPRLKIGWHVKLCGRFFRRFLKPWRDHVQMRLQDELPALVEVAQRCQTRAELEEVFGPPKYAMRGELYGIEPPHGDNSQAPDSVECYEKDSLAVELWFKDGEYWQAIGFVPASAWDVVSSDSYWARSTSVPPP